MTATMVNDLVDRIDIHKAEGKRSDRTQQVDVHYRFIDEGLS